MAERKATPQQPSAKPDLPVLAFWSGEDWSEWLEANHDLIDAIRLKFAKKGSGQQSLTYAEALEAALCYGWIDGQAKPLDEVHWLQRFGTRRPRSKWSKRNCQLAMRLIEEGMMRPAGLRQVEAARLDGRWEAAYDSPRNAQVPADLQSALEANPKAAEFFTTLTSTNRYAILYRIQDAKRPETRARRIEQFVAMLSEGRTIHPQKTKAKPNGEA